MIITNAIVLSRKKSTKFLGEVFAFQSNEEVIVDGVVSDISLDSYATGHTAPEDIYVNGNDFGTGVIKSLVSSAKNQGGTDQRIKVTFEVFKTGSGTALSSEYPTINASNFQYVKSFTETSSCDINQDVQSYTHSVNVKLTMYDGTGLTTAQGIAQTFLSSNSLTSLVGAAYNTLPNKTFFDESYDEINSECHFVQKYEVATNPDSTSTYILFRSNSLNYDAAGIATVTENAEYQDLTGNGAPTAQATSDISGAYARCTSIINNLTNVSSNVGSMTLINSPLSKGTTIDNDSRKVSYHITYSTDLKVDPTDKVYIEYTNTIETTNAGVTYNSVDGNIVGMGAIDSSSGPTTKYNNALARWQTILNSLALGSASMTGKPHSFTTNHNWIKGTISFNIKLSNSASIIYPINGKVRRITNKVSNQPVPRFLAQVFKVINNNEIMQIAKNSNLLPSMYISNTVVNGDSTSKMSDLISQVILAAPIGTANYGVSASFTFNSNTRQLNASLQSVEVPPLTS